MNRMCLQVLFDVRECGFHKNIHDNTTLIDKSSTRNAILNVTETIEVTKGQFGHARSMSVRGNCYDLLFVHIGLILLLEMYCIFPAARSAEWRVVG